MNEVRRAVIMAAGKGERLRPLTLETPKPLIRVSGKRIIDTVIDALFENGIKEIFIVNGYLKDRFEELKEKYTDIVLIDNPCYSGCNNISSLYFARELLDEPVMILDGDQIICDPSVLRSDFELSGYNSVWTDSHTDEWLMTVSGGRVESCSRNGGSGGWQLFSVSRWTKADAVKLAQHLEYEFITRKERDIYWDDVPMFRHFDDYELGIFEMKAGSIIEIDSLADLAMADESYLKYMR